jgi:hypothetical protein
VLTASAARWLLVLHTALGVAAVGSATHLFLWLYRGRTIGRYAWLVVALIAGAFLAGNAMYPTYKVEVRAAYLDSPTAVTNAAAAHEHELAVVAAREHVSPPETEGARARVRSAAKIARWFDVKEHWVALGLFAALALAAILAFWRPADGGAIRSVVLCLAGLTAGTAWLAAIIGVLVSSWRAV